MLKRALYLCLLTSATLALLACGGKKDEDALMEDEGAAKPAASASTAAAPAAGAPAAAPAAGGATVTGKVNFEGTAPAMAPIKMDADAFCKSEHKEPVYEQEVVVNPNKTLEWVLVYVKEGVTGTYPVPTEASHARPARLPVPPARVRHAWPASRSRSSTATARSTTSTRCRRRTPSSTSASRSRAWRRSRSSTAPRCRSASSATCTSGWARTAACSTHPFFAVTNDQGAFEIKNLPPGNYVIEAWHEKYGTQTQNVTITGTDAKTVDFNFKG